MQPQKNLTQTQVDLLGRIFGIHANGVESEGHAERLLGERLQMLDHAHQVAERLMAEGFTLLAIRLGHHAALRVKPTVHCRALDSVIKGRSHDGLQPYVEFAAVVDGVAVEWKKPLTDARLGICRRKH